MSQPGLFPEPEAPRPPQSRTVSASSRVDRPRWARYRPRVRIQCSECVLVLYENHGAGPAVLGARWRLTVGKDVWYLCDPHAELRKQEQ